MNHCVNYSFFYYAFSLYGCTDCMATGNLAEKTSVGFYCIGTAMFKGNTVREAATKIAETTTDEGLQKTIQSTVFPEF